MISLVCSAAPLRAMRLMSQLPLIRCRFLRKNSLASRLIRFRWTASPTLRLAVTPSRDFSLRLGATTAMKNSPRTVRPELDKPTNSERFRILSAFLRKKRNGVATSGCRLTCRLHRPSGINRPGECVPWPGGGSTPDARPWWPCVSEIHDCVHAAVCWAETVFS
jgi:hypothetical protein